MCNCIQTIVLGVKEHHEKNEPDTGTRNAYFLLGVGYNINIQQRRTSSEVIYTHQRKKKNGTLEREKQKKITVYHNFCPFCGEKYPEEKTVKDDQPGD